MRTKSDHKLVMTKSLFEWKYNNTPKHRYHIIYKLLYAKITQAIQIRNRKTNEVTATTTAAENTLEIN